MHVPHRNIDHVIRNQPCTDPDCEIHNPECIEDWDSRLTSKAFFLAGALALLDLMDNYDPDNEGISLSESESGSCIAELIDAHDLKED